MEKLRYVVSPYTYYGDSSRPRSWSVWDTKEEEWASGYVGGKQGTEAAADDLNYAYHECPECRNIQVEELTAETVKCDRCGVRYHPKEA